MSGLAERRLSTVAPEDVQWLWPSRIAQGKLNIVMGDPGLGKSYVCLDVCARVSAGYPWEDGSGNAPLGNCIILTAEDGLADTIRPRLDKLGADCERIIAITGVQREDEEGEGYFSLMDDIPLLEESVVRHEAKLVYLDPINAYLLRVDTHKAAEVRQALMPLSQMAERTRCAVVAVHHLNKSTGGTNALYRASGSIDFGAAARSVCGVAKDPEDDTGARRVFLTVKLNIAKFPEGMGFTITEDEGVVWDRDPVTSDALAAFNSGADNEDTSKTAQVKQALTEALGTGAEIPEKEIQAWAAEAGISMKTVKRVKQSMSIVSKKRGFGIKGDWVWTWPCPPESARVDDCPTPTDEDAPTEYEQREWAV